MTDVDPEATAWQIHAALADWTGKVDSKANFALTLESAALGGIIAFMGSGHHLGQLHGWLPKSLFWTGITLLSLAALAAVSAVMPRLGSGDSSSDNFIYFGHLRLWKVDDLEERLRTASPLESLSQQLVMMSRTAWTKHQRVRQSLYLAVFGVAGVAIAWIAG